VLAVIASDASQSVWPRALDDGIICVNMIPFTVGGDTRIDRRARLDTSSSRVLLGPLGSISPFAKAVLTLNQRIVGSMLTALINK
jgi:hypothetical protein